LRTDPVRNARYGSLTREKTREKGKGVHPFVSYEMAKDIVEEMLANSKQRNRWRRVPEKVVAPAPSWDVAVRELMTTDAAGEQERVGA
jgi:hypothetical protein